MRFNSVRTGNYAQSAQAVTRASDQIFDAAMSGKPDFTKISKAAIQGRSLERRAVTKAEGNVAKAGLEAFTYAKRTKNAVETEKAIADIKRPAKRMAGIVGGLGALATGYVGMQESKKAKAERDELRAYRDQLDAKADARDAAWEARHKELMDTFASKPDSTEAPKTMTPASGSTPSPSSDVQPTSKKGFRGEVYNYLTQSKGLSKNKALGLMANIDRESSFRIAPSGGDGGNSFGMFQWNNTYGRSDIMKKNVKDWQTNWKGQIDHALSSNQLPEYNKVTTDYLNTTFETPQAAADYWMRHWERPAHQERDSKKHTEFLSGYNF